MSKKKKQAKQKKGYSGVIRNRRARYDYALEEGFRFGLVLNGKQVRAIRDNHLSLSGSFVTVKDGEMWLMNAKLTLPKTSKQSENLTVSEPIKLLATGREMQEIEAAKKSGRTVVPTEVLNKTKFIKLRASIGKGKKKYDKREDKKKRDFELKLKRQDLTRI